MTDPERQRELEEQVDQLTRALRTRVIIGQAQGIIMALQDVDADGAFQVLCEIASPRNMKVRDVAALIVAARTIPDSPGDLGTPYGSARRRNGRPPRRT